MKRKLPHIIIVIITASLSVSLASCRSSKKDESSFYESNIEGFKKDKHKNDKNGKSVSKIRKKIVDEAISWKGTPYGYGMSERGKGSDCSGMVMSVYEKVAGVKLPRNSAKQQEYCKHLKKKEVKIGDLCFFATGKDPDKVSHVGIMIDDKNFIHASTSKGVVVSDITQPYYVRTFKGYGRVPDL